VADRTSRHGGRRSTRGASCRGPLRARCRPAVGVLASAALVLAVLGACTGGPEPLRGGGSGTEPPTVGPYVGAQQGGDATGVDMTPVPEAQRRAYAVPEAPRIADDTLRRPGPGGALRPGATYRLRVGPALQGPDEVVASPVVAELTPSGDVWWLGDHGIVTEGRRYLPEDAAIRVFQVDGVESGPCFQRRPHERVDPGPTPGDLARAVIDRYAFTVVEAPRPVDRFGGTGVHLVLRLADAVDAERCLDFNLETYRQMAGLSQIVELWIVLVDGERIVVERSWFPDTGRGLLDLQLRTLDSLRLFTP
jgi:hypothetical protein